MKLPIAPSASARQLVLPFRGQAIERFQNRLVHGNGLQLNSQADEDREHHVAIADEHASQTLDALQLA